MDDNYTELVRKSADFKATKADQYLDLSKERLLKIGKKKIQTTMIGALSTLEKRFGFLWGQDQDKDLTPEQEHMKELYEEIRSEILDRGNNQMRNLEAEFVQYDIKWLRYTVKLPVIPVTQDGEN
tara:strand:- start:136 stop:510 length:375 start_codon:yes stop_codon:yes gene_type:complete